MVLSDYLGKIIMVSIREKLLILYILLLSGCTFVDVQRSINILSDRKPCCYEYSDVQFQVVESTRKNKFGLDYQDLIMNFPHGKSYFEAFEIPSGSEAIEVRSYSGEYLPKATYVDPVVVQLNSTYEVIQIDSNIPFRRDFQQEYIIAGEWYFVSELVLSKEAKFVLIYANNSSSRTLVNISENGTRWPTPPAPAGVLAITFRIGIDS